MKKTTAGNSSWTKTADRIQNKATGSGVIRPRN